MRKLNLLVIFVFAVAIAMVMAKTGHHTGYGFSWGF
jgi:hypothetical protein